MKKPNFFVVGAMKSGTTSLYDVLNQHPEVYMSPIKEPHHFCKDITCDSFYERYKKQTCFNIKKYLKSPVLSRKHIAFIDDEKDYLELFREVDGEEVVGEISNGYLVSECAHHEIFSFDAKAKIVILLRNPIERAFSHWMMESRHKLEKINREDFLNDIQFDFEADEKGWGKNELYIDAGLYYEQVKRYLDTFPQEQVLILFFDELKENPNSFYKKIFDFLSIASISNSECFKKSNESFIPKYRLIYYFLQNSRASFLAKRLLGEAKFQKISGFFKSNKARSKISNDEKKIVINYFIEDIKKLEQLLKVDLSDWYTLL